MITEGKCKSLIKTPTNNTKPISPPPAPMTKHKLRHYDCIPILIQGLLKISYATDIKECKKIARETINKWDKERNREFND